MTSVKYYGRRSQQSMEKFSECLGNLTLMEMGSSPKKNCAEYSPRFVSIVTMLLCVNDASMGQVYGNHQQHLTYSVLIMSFRPART